MKRFLCLSLSLSLLVMFCGCSDSNALETKLAKTFWVYEDYKENGFAFTEDGNWYMWEIVENPDETGEIIESALKKYKVTKNTITFFDMNLIVENETIKDATFDYEIANDQLTLHYKNDKKAKVQSFKLNKVNSIQEHGETIGVKVPNYGGK